MCTALVNLKKEGIQEGMIKAYQKMDLSDDETIQMLREEFELTYEEAEECLNRN